MDRVWSTYVQTTEELYESRRFRFRDETKELWLGAIGAEPGDRVLEVGCAGGAFCHRLKEYRPDLKLTGLDLDLGHIAFARSKTAELRQEIDFVAGDATAMPFADASFDLCFSHTVFEHIPHAPFLGEQMRVLRPGGRIVVLSVRSRLGIKNRCELTDMGEEERALMDKAWQGAEMISERIAHVGAYEVEEHAYPCELEKAGFRGVQVGVITMVDYAPDNAGVTKEEALAQINARRLADLAPMQKALAVNPDALCAEEQARLAHLIHARYDRRIEAYLSGQKLWDFTTSTVLCVSGVK